MFCCWLCVVVCGGCYVVLECCVVGGWWGVGVVDDFWFGVCWYWLYVVGGVVWCWFVGVVLVDWLVGYVLVLC